MKTNLCPAVCFTLIGAGALLAQPAYFTRITEGVIATNAQNSWGCSLVDYDNDGLVDVFVATTWDSSTNELYHNEGNFLFSKATTEPVVTTIADYCAGVFADYDNDGDLDLFATGYQPYKSSFFRNNLGDGNPTLFSRITTGAWVNTAARSIGAAWGDYDSDGFVDLAVANSYGQNEFLYRNDGAGGMIPVSALPLTSSGGDSQNVSWADYDGDGDLDLFVANAPDGPGQNCLLFRNDGGGTFTPIAAPFDATGNYWLAPSWADFDNDGDLDLFMSQGGGRSNDALYRNDGNDTFTLLEDNLLTIHGWPSLAGAWGDFDNDGYLDFFSCGNVGLSSFLYRNQRDGTFVQVQDDSFQDPTDSYGVAWADLDHDGFLDLFIANGTQTFEPNAPGLPNFLYRNNAKANGNSNGWLLIRMVGTASNRSAIGAKVRVKSILWGKEVWQMREISGGGGASSQSDLRAHFGLGDATQVDVLRIEWPSGIVQTLTNVAPNQILTITEHQAGVTNAPSLTVTKPAEGPVQLAATGQTNLRYVFEASSDLARWTKTAVRTNLTGSVAFTPAASSTAAKFYRVQVP